MAVLDILIILVLATVPAVFFKQRFKIEVQGPLCLWRTKRGLKLLEQLAKYKRLLRAFSDIGFIFAFGLFGAAYLFLDSKKRLKDFLIIALAYALFIVVGSIVAVPVIFTGGSAVPMEFLICLYIGGTGSFILYGLVLNSWIIIQDYMLGLAPVPGIAPLIPGVAIEGSPISIPFHAIFGLIVLIIVHEMAHGIVARMEGFRVKSLGLLTAGIFPIGAFTEPDEGQLKKAPMRQRMRVFSSGSMSNFLFGIIFMALFLAAMALAQPTFVQDPNSFVPSFIPWSDDYISGMIVTSVISGSPAEQAGIANGTKIYNYDILSSEKIPFASETLETDMGDITLQRDANGYMGFSSFISRSADYPVVVLFEKYLIESLFWIFILNFLIGIINFLPFAIFDGARISEDLVNFYAKKAKIKNKKVGKEFVKVLTLFIALLFVINALPYFIASF